MLNSPSKNEKNKILQGAETKILLSFLLLSEQMSTTQTYPYNYRYQYKITEKRLKLENLSLFC